jgi:ABC-type nitrate/sulfonate/bicarbonate transport system permease component
VTTLTDPTLAVPAATTAFDEHPRGAVTAALKRALRALVNACISIAIGLLVWEALVRFSGVTPFIAKSPGDVYKYLFVVPKAAANRAALMSAFWETARDASVGFIVGTVGAVLLANLFVLRRGVEQAVMPLAMTLRTVPLISMAPLIALIFGRGLMAVTVIAGIVTFFPTLVNVTLALRAVPSESLDLMRAYGASNFVTLRKVQFPSALPALFASARIAAPLALVGALLAEWLATGQGLGYVMLTSIPKAQYAQMWAAVVIITVASVLLYSLISGIETYVLARYAPGRSRQVL